MIKFDKVSKRYANGNTALNQISFNLAKGEMAFITGHSGAGKSTLLKLIALIERSQEGQIFLQGQNLKRITAAQIPYIRRRIGLIFQNPYLLTENTVFENVLLPLIIEGLEKREAARRVRAALDKVGLLSKEKVLPTQLSCGEQQRVGIARAIVNKPALLLADEPTGNLDPTLSAEIMRLFEQFNQIGVSVLVASHDLGLIATMKYRILTLKNGHLISDSAARN
jgi:cell division transport system ATP-binding protein